MSQWRSSDIIKEQYGRANYRIVYHPNCKKNNCIIFFTSHSLYPNNTEAEIADYLLVRDYYEWVSISQNEKLQDYAQKFIFVRDIYKQWYARGINAQFDCVDHLVAFLREETQGFHVTTCGSSAGGYAAALIGNLLGVEKIIDFSGQFAPEMTTNDVQMFVACYQDAAKGQYRDITPLLKASTSPCFYFFPAKSEIDVVQYKHAIGILGKEHPCFFPVGVDSSVHGMPLDPQSAIHVITSPVEHCIDLYRHCSGKQVSKFAFLAQTNGLPVAISTLLKAIRSKICR